VVRPRYFRSAKKLPTSLAISPIRQERVHKSGNGKNIPHSCRMPIASATIGMSVILIVLASLLPVLLTTSFNNVLPHSHSNKDSPSVQRPPIHTQHLVSLRESSLGLIPNISSQHLSSSRLSSPKANARVLVVYAYWEKDLFCKANLEYFLQVNAIVTMCMSY
jgi:hypothetical protein